MARINPFHPNSPVSPGMFVGRLPQLDSLEQALIQTRAGRAKGCMVTGERGIGKTSLLQYFKYVAQGSIAIADEKVNFLVLEVDLDGSTTDIGLIQRVELALNRELANTEQARSFLTKGWKFLSRLEVAGVKVRDGATDTSAETLHDEFAYSLATTTKRITQDDAASVFGARYDGIVLLIDEADNAPRELQLGSLLKLLTERMQRHGCSRFMVCLAGLPRLRDVLRESHASSLRIFDELQLDTLTRDEASMVIDRALEEAEEENDQQTTIDDAGRDFLISVSEGYPHFIQQFGYSAFEADTDGIIDQEDARTGAFDPGGALEKIGDRYYRDDFYNKIQKDSYRQVLRIMAANANRWVAKKEIRSKFKGKDSTLDNAIQALRERKIILSKEGVRGVYGLQHRGFAFWIRLYTTDPRELQAQIEATSDGT